MKKCNTQDVPVRILRANIIVPLLMAALVVLCAARPAHAIFERYSLYGLSANSFALGSPAMPSQRDPLKYLSNPAFIAEVYSRNYTLSFGNFKSVEGAGIDYKFSLFSLTKPQKNAWTVALTEDAGISRKLITYTFGGGSGSMLYGVNFNGYKFDVNGSDTSGFSMDLGVMFKENKLTYGLAIKNFISTTSATEVVDEDTRLSRKLPRVVSFGINYQLRPDVHMNLGWHKFKADPTSTSAKDHDSSAVTIGFEYDLKRDISFLMAGSQEKSTVADNTSDKLMLAGLGYRTPQYNLGYGFMNKNNFYTNAQVMTLAYKVGGTWDAPPAPTVLPVSGRVEPEITFEEPLPAMELARADDIQNVIYGDKMSSAPSDPTPVFVKDSLAIQDVSVSPRAILVPAYNRPQFGDISGHWAEKYIKMLSEDGFFANRKPGDFGPNAPATREEFYRLLFVTQLTRLFGDPLVVLFTTDQPVRAEVTLLAPHLDKPMNLIAGKYDEIGEKRLVLDRALFAKRGVFPGRYTVRIHLSNDAREGYVEEQITVLDSSVDFSSIAPLSGESREQRVRDLIQRLSALGLNLEYLNNLARQGSLTRVEALMATLDALGAGSPGDFDTPPFSDVSALSKPERSAVYLGSRGLPSLGGQPLMAGYSTREFQPTQELSRAESAALVYRASRVDAADFKGPYRKADYLYTQAESGAPAARYYPSSDRRSNAVYEQPPLTSYTVPESAPASAPAATPQPSPSAVKFLVIAGSFMDPLRAEAALAELTRMGYPAYTLFEQVGNVTVYNAVINAYSDSDSAQALAQTVIPGYKLKVRRIVSSDTALNQTLPVPPRAKRTEPGYSPDREVPMNVKTGDEAHN